MAATSLLSAACAALAILSPSTAFVPSSRGNQLAAAVKSSLSVSSGSADDTTQPVSLSPPSPEASRRDILSKAASSVLGLSSALVVLGPGDSAGAFQPGPVTAQSAANKAAYAHSYQVGAGVDFELLSNSLTFECRNPQLPGGVVRP